MIFQKAAGYKRLWELLYRSNVITKTKKLGKINVITLKVFLLGLILCESPHTELSIDVIASSKLISSRILNTLLKLDKIIWPSSILINKGDLLCLDRILDYIALPLIFFLHTDSPLRVKSDEHCLKYVFCHD